jgi:RimJ/RimL family protein N-acetyltransferase
MSYARAVDAVTSSRRDRQSRHWSDAPAFRDRELSLVPLHPRYTASWWCQSRDEHLVRMTQLPLFADERWARRWIESCWAATLEPVSLERAQRYTFAVILSDAEGATADAAEASRFVGSVSLVRKGVAAYLSFWVGVDHRRQGIATRAVRVATRAALRHLGLRYLFAASFRHNAPSHRVMLRSGWERLPISGEPPSDDIDFFQGPVIADRGPTPPQSHRLLNKLLRDIDSDFVLAPPSRVRPGLASGQTSAGTCATMPKLHTALRELDRITWPNGQRNG